MRERTCCRWFADHRGRERPICVIRLPLSECCHLRLSLFVFVLHFDECTCCSSRTGISPREPPHVNERLYFQRSVFGVFSPHLEGSETGKKNRRSNYGETERETRRKELPKQGREGTCKAEEADAGHCPVWTHSYSPSLVHRHTTRKLRSPTRGKRGTAKKRGHPAIRSSAGTSLPLSLLHTSTAGAFGRLDLTTNR